MREMTKENLKAAFAGESQAHMKYLAFCDKAEKEGFSNIARMFRAIAYAEQVHATNHFRTLEGIGSTIDNLKAAINGENFEVDEMYPAYLAVSELQEEKPATTSMNFALETEKVHARMYGNALESVLNGKDINIGVISICPVCGYTFEGDTPDRCPVCRAPKEKFQIFA